MYCCKSSATCLTESLTSTSGIFVIITSLPLGLKEPNELIVPPCPVKHFSSAQIALGVF